MAAKSSGSQASMEPATSSSDVPMRVQNVPPAAVTLQASLASSALCSAPVNNFRARVTTAGFMFPARRTKQPKQDAYSGLVAMLDDFFPVSCVLRRHGCWPKKRRQTA